MSMKHLSAKEAPQKERRFYVKLGPSPENDISKIDRHDYTIELKRMSPFAKRKNLEIAGRENYFDQIYDIPSATRIRPTPTPRIFAPSNGTGRNIRIDKRRSKRQFWSNKIEFYMAIIAYCAGLGPVFRFPQLMALNGGAAFLIPFIILIVLLGVPIYFLDLALGQFANRSAVSCWAICPLLKGIGWTTVLMQFAFATYHSVMLAHAGRYFVMSFTTNALEWSTCGNSWNTENCTPILRNDSASLNFSLKHSPGVEHFQFRFLNVSSSIQSFGRIQLQIVISLAVIWILVTLALYKRLVSLCRILYFTMTIAAVILLALLVRVLALPGVLSFGVLSDVGRLADWQVWFHAALYSFELLGLGWGILITLGSHSNFNNDSFRDAVILPILIAIITITIGFILLPFAHHLASAAHSEVETLFREFASAVVFEVVASMPASQVWSALFFLLLICLGANTQLVYTHCFLTSILDETFLNVKRRRLVLTIGLCAAMFSAALIFTTQGLNCKFKAGIHLLEFVLHYIPIFAPLVATLLTTIAIAWIYGSERFLDDIRLMIGHRPGILVSVLWKFVCSLLLMGLLVGTIIIDVQDHMDGQDLVIIGYFLAVTMMISIPLYAVVLLCKAPGPGTLQKIRRCVTASEDWAPAAHEKKIEWYGLRLLSSYNQSFLRNLKHFCSCSRKGRDSDNVPVLSIWSWTLARAEECSD